MRNKVKKQFSKKAVVLLSGGLDSATTLYSARESGYEVNCLIFDYGQRHKKEINCAKQIARRAGCKFQVIKISMPWKGSALLENKKKLPVTGHKRSGQIPATYVPARNIIFLSFALSYAEVIKAEAIFIGAHAQDYSGYPDCRPEFFQAFDKVIKIGTKAGIEKKQIKIIAPLINRTKKEIIGLGMSLGVPYGLTWSCYQGAAGPCGKCDSCYYRAKGFKEAGIKDPIF